MQLFSQGCFNSSEGEGLLKTSIAKTASRRASVSPTIFIGGRRYNGQRSVDDFVAAICYDEFPDDDAQYYANYYMMVSLGVVMAIMLSMTVVGGVVVYVMKKRRRRRRRLGCDDEVMGVQDMDDEDDDDDEEEDEGDEKVVVGEGGYQMVPVVTVGVPDAPTPLGEDGSLHPQ